MEMAENTTTSSESMRPTPSPNTTKKHAISNHGGESENVNAKHMQSDRPTNGKVAIGNLPLVTQLKDHKENRWKRKILTSQSGEGPNGKTSTCITKKRKTKEEGTSMTKACDTQPQTSCDNSKEVVAANKTVPEKSGERMLSRPSIPPKPAAGCGRIPPPRLKQKLLDNEIVIQKLNAGAEQLRLEISDLRAALASERSAVRALRAQNEAKSRKSKSEVKKLQAFLDATQKVIRKTGKDKGTKEATVNNDMGKMCQEIATLKDVNKILEEKIQIAQEAERRKTSEIRSLKDSYEIRLTQITKSAKTEINRLLEELKAKERNIGQLKKELLSLRNDTNKTNLRNAQCPPKMKKFNGIERRKLILDSSNRKVISTTCGEPECNSVPHELTNRILETQTNLPMFENKDHLNSDTDSALSSAPQSMSPQPPILDVENLEIWQSMKNYSIEISNLQSDNENLLRENTSLKNELEFSHQQIKELEESSLQARNQNAGVEQLEEKIKHLEAQEDILRRQVDDLQEQNDLLEFRIIELDGANEKMKNYSTEISNLQTENEGLREENASLRNELEFFKQQTKMLEKSAIEVRNQNAKVQQLQEEILYIRSQEDSLQKEVAELREQNELLEFRIIELEGVSEKVKANQETFSDYSSINEAPETLSFIWGNCDLGSGQTASPSNSKRSRSWYTNSLQESGVFESDSVDICSQYTQTEPDDSLSPPVGELCAEIRKLNEFREKIEESVSKDPVPVVLSSNLCDQKKLAYYRDRLEVLEKKLAVYESSGDQQIKKLADRLQREVQLEFLVKDYEQQIKLLSEDNSRLEEERCELEEVENDTRLKLQRLEIDLEILGQRNLELEMSKEAAHAKLQEFRQSYNSLQDSVAAHQKEISNLESREKDYKNSLNLIKTAMPAILLFNSFIVNGRYLSDDRGKGTMDSDLRKCTCHEAEKNAYEARIKLQQLMAREKELTQNITELNRAYNETLESADNLWAQMEKDYKDRIDKAYQTECLLKAKVAKLEERIAADSQSALERLSHLEESETCHKNRICRLNKENKTLTQKNESLQNDYQKLKAEYLELKSYLEVVVQQNLEREKQKSRKLEEDIVMMNKMIQEADEAHETETQYLRNQLAKSGKELLHIEVTNSELKEEVNTLEMRICELIEQRSCDKEKIRNLMDELRSVSEDAFTRPRQAAVETPNLAEELAPSKRMNLAKIADLADATGKLSEAINFTEN